MGSKKTKKSYKNPGSAKFVERPQQFDCIQFHGPEDFDDGVLAEWLKKYEIAARISGPLDYLDDGVTPNGEIVLELTGQRFYSDEPLVVWEECWIIITNERLQPKVMHNDDFHQRYMPVNEYNS